MNSRVKLRPNLNVKRRASFRVIRRPNLLLKALLIFFSIMLIFISLWKLIDSSGATNGWPIYIVSIIFIWSCLYIIVTYQYFGTFYLFTTAYIVSLLVFHLGHVVMHSFGWEDLAFYESGGIAIWYERAGWCTLLAIGSLGLGVGISLRNRYQNIEGVSNVRNPMEKRNLFSAYWVGVGLLGASFASLLITFLVGGNILQYSRNEIFGGAVSDIRGFGFFILIIPSALILIVVGSEKKLEKVFSYSLASIIALVLLLLGYRSSVLFSGMVAAILWVKTGKRIPVIVAVLMITFVLVAIPTVRYLRDLGSFQEVTEEKIVKSYRSTSMKEVLQEVGGVNGIMADVLKWVPENEDFWSGQSYLWALSRIVPNIGFRQGSSERNRSSALHFGGNKNILHGNPATWYIYHTNRWKYDRGLGSGFSAIAEPYLNFGYPGIVFYFGILGFLLCRLDYVNLRVSRGTLIFSAAMLWPLMKTVRNSFVVFIKPLGLIVAVIILWRIITFWKRKARKRKRNNNVNRQRRIHQNQDKPTQKMRRAATK